MKGRIIKTFENFNIRDLDLGRFSEKIDKSNLRLNSDGTYNYIGGLEFTNMKLTSLLELPIRFKYVQDNFWCSTNNLISLEGSPEIVGGTFVCSYNNLISLQYAPKEIGSRFISYENNLLSKKFLSELKGRFESPYIPFSKEEVIKTIKRMSFEQRLKELEFFEKYDLIAYEIMKDILIKENLGFGEETRSMVGVMKGYTNAKEMF